VLNSPVENTLKMKEAELPGLMLPQTLGPHKPLTPGKEGGFNLTHLKERSHPLLGMHVCMHV